ncbi:MAG: hypothetical protein MI724_18820 [Spirochaetales bacterium]|nr:hypothetical protein [Spirochaetales bacterium]
MTFGLYLLLNLALLSILVVWLRRLVVRRLAPERILRELHGEIQTLVAEVNQTSDHNISIIEDRIASLRELVHNADRQIEELEGLLQRVSEAAPEEVYSLPLQTARHEHAEPSGEAGRSTDATPSAATREAAAVTDDHHRTVSEEPPAEEERDRRTRVAELYEQGLSPELISSHTGVAIGEVELIISLIQGRARR